MALNGITTESDENCILFKINHFSEEIKQCLRDNLAGIWHGMSEVDEMPDVFTFSQTVESFLDIYSTKALNTKKGMLGELLAHTLLNSYMTQMEPVSILKNMEERQIKKGFDLIYYHPQSKQLWYSEVKSGLSSNGDSSTDYNMVLLDRAKNGIVGMLNEGRKKLWEKAIVEAKLVLDENRRIDIRKMLGNELKNVGNNELKNTILVSVLYHDLVDEIEYESLGAKHDEYLEEGCFQAHIVVSIQKHTLAVIEAFLEEESQKNG